jgi:hypothetical protein
LAIICFKNGIDKYWRSSKQFAISKQEKNEIKTRVFSLLHEKNNQLTVQNAHAIARIARFDFPGEWPSLFDDIARSLEQLVFKTNDLVSTNNLLIILNQIIKAITAVRIGRARHAMQAKAPLITTVLMRLYIKFFQGWTQNLDLTLMELCYSCLKNLRRIIPEGFEQPHKNHDVAEFINLSVDHLEGLVLEHDKYSSDLLERYVKCYTKLYFNMVSGNPTSFILLPSSQKIISLLLLLLEQKAEHIYNSTEDNDFWEVLALKGFMILKKIVSYIYKKGAITLKLRNDKAEIETSINKITTETFTPQTILHLCDIIINWYLRLKPSDLESWQLESEEWVNEEYSSSWEYQIRPCAENFYQDLITYFPDILVPFIINKISNGLLQNDSVENILTKDSILCTFQLSSTALGNHVNFDQLLNDIFIPEGLRNDLAENKILKRRMCLIISEWVGVQCSRESRISIYKLLIDFMQPENKNNDIVVKLATVQTLMAVVNDWDFQKADFKPFMNEVVKLLMNVLPGLELTETKMYIFKTLSVLLEKCNPLVDEQALMDILQVVTNSNDENEPILKSSLLRLLRSLTVTLNEQSPRTYSLSLPLIQSCCSENSPLYTLLSEDGYDLWLSLLQYAPQTQLNNSDLLNLFTMVPNGLMNSTEILPTILSIMRSYALFAPHLYTTDLSVELFRVLSGYVPNMRDDSFSIFIALMDILFLQNSSNEVFINNVVESGLISAIIKYILDDDKSVVLVNKMFIIISRLTKSNAGVFLQIVDHLSFSIEEVLKVWNSHYNSNGNPRNKKINLLGLISLTTNGITNAMNLNLYAPYFTETIKKTFMFLEEIKETVDGTCDAYKQDYIYEDIDDYSYHDSTIVPNGEKLRYMNVLQNHDPIFSENLRLYLKNSIINVKNRLSQQDFNHLISLNDTYTIECINGLI